MISFERNVNMVIQLLKISVFGRPSFTQTFLSICVRLPAFPNVRKRPCMRYGMENECKEGRKRCRNAKKLITHVHVTTTKDQL